MKKLVGITLVGLLCGAAVGCGPAADKGKTNTAAPKAGDPAAAPAGGTGAAPAGDPAAPSTPPATTP